MNENLPSFSLWQQLRAPQFDASGRPDDTLTWDQLVPNPFYQLPGVTGSIANNKNIAFNQFLNPVKILGGITENDNPWGQNRYDACSPKSSTASRGGSA